MTDVGPGAPAADPRVGRLLDGRYRLLDRLARGGTATVYRGLDERLERPVAVKVMHPALADDPDFLARFAREARSAARLSAPEVVAVYDTGRDELTGASYLVMEHVEGRDLRAVLTDHGPLPPQRALQVLEPVLRALAAAHRAGLVHRDVKPENVLLGNDGRIKVADFGLARAVETSDIDATTGLLIGTAAYLAPEQVTRGTADPRTDVYAAGIVLWEALTGRPPYVAETPLAVAYRHVHEDVPPPSSGAGPLPAALDALVVRATRRDPDQRPPDAGAFLAELRRVREALPRGGPAGDVPVVPQQPGPHREATRVLAGPPRRQATQVLAGPPPPPAPRRRRGRAALVGLVALVVVTAGTGAGWAVNAARWTTAPTVLALSGTQAADRLRTAGLASTTSEPRFDEQVPAGQVLAQEPAPGERIRKGAVLTYVLSKGPDRRTVPAVAGRSRGVAVASLERVGLRAGPVTERFSSRPSGTVLSSTPAAGAALRPDTPVGLVVSKGLELLPVPGVTGRSQAEAQAALSAAGFRSSVQQQPDEQVPAGSVVRQTPAGGTAPRGTRVRLVVSSGPEMVVVPDLAGLDQAQADAALAGRGLVGAGVQPLFGDGRAAEQSPAPGTQVRRGTTVTYLLR